MAQYKDRTGIQIEVRRTVNLRELKWTNCGQRVNPRNQRLTSETVSFSRMSQCSLSSTTTLWIFGKASQSICLSLRAES